VRRFVRGGSAVVCGGSGKSNEIKVRRFCGAYVPGTPYYPYTFRGAY